jgi:regulator of RNase E activity RraA
MSAPLTAEDLEALRKLSTPTICNAIEQFNVRPRNTGFFNNEIKCVFPQFGPMVGFATTATIRAERPDAKPDPLLTRWKYWTHILSQPAPRIAVIEDLDDPPAVGSLWGDVNANTHKALGAIGTITNGGVRDLDEVEELKFHFFAAHVIPSHAYVHIEEVGIPVKVGGLIIKPGDLIHADQHGITTVPIEIARDIPRAAREVAEREARIIGLCQSKDFSVEKLWALASGGKPIPTT